MSDNKLKNFLRTVSARLLVLQKKCDAALFRRIALWLRGMVQLLREKGSRLLSHLRTWMLAIWAWLRTNCTRETLISWLKQLPGRLTPAALWNGLRRVYPEKILIPCLCLILLSVSGNPGTLAWYTDEDSIRNTFEVGTLELQVEYKNDQTSAYRELTETSNVFNDYALYEPGYTQVVYFKVYNKGNIPFNYQFRIKENGFTDSTSVLGNPLHLADYLRFGVVVAATEPELDRAVAQTYANMDLDVNCHIGTTYVENSDLPPLAPGDTHYAALIVYMPTTVGNEANYDRANGEPPPQVTLGITVYAQQHDAPMPAN